MIDLKQQREWAQKWADKGYVKIGVCPKAIVELLDMLEAAKLDAARLDFLIEEDAFVMWALRDGTINQCQLMTQDEDENYHYLSGEHRFFNTPREAIDAAMAATKG